MIYQITIKILAGSLVILFMGTASGIFKKISKKNCNSCMINPISFLAVTAVTVIYPIKMFFLLAILLTALGLDNKFFRKGGQ